MTKTTYRFVLNYQQWQVLMALVDNERNALRSEQPDPMPPYWPTLLELTDVMLAATSESD